MSSTQSAIISRIRHLLTDVICGTGKISGSVYDTAQLLRWAPPDDPTPALTWLLAQQKPDGGWGDPRQPYYRQPATLAAILALHQHQLPQIARAIQTAVAFLHANSSVWAELREDMPVGAELIMPRLCDEAAEQGIVLPDASYAALRELGAQRRRLIQQIQPRAATTAAHSWEAWGVEPHPELLDETGGVGHSPAATAAWLHAARAGGISASEIERAQTYLDQAARATGSGVSGVVPAVWPNKDFEIVFGLFSLYCAGLLDHPSLRDLVNPMLVMLARRTKAQRGVGFSPFFSPDGDDTATAMVVLYEAGYNVSPELLRPFAREQHFATWNHELQMSLSTTAHAVHALALLHQPIETVVESLIERQHPDGYWHGDKWHSSPYYITSQSMLALHAARQHEAVQRAAEWLLDNQQADGGWGIHGSTRIETAYAILALRPLAHQQRVRTTISRAEAVLLNDTKCESAHWIAKVLYRPIHVDLFFELSAVWVLATLSEKFAGNVCCFQPPFQAANLLEAEYGA